MVEAAILGGGGLDPGHPGRFGCGRACVLGATRSTASPEPPRRDRLPALRCALRENLAYLRGYRGVEELGARPMA